MTATFGWEPLADLLNEPNIRDLVTSYWAELSPIKAVAPLDPDWSGMLDAERKCRFKVWTARVDGSLAGFIAWHIVPHLMHNSTLFAIDAGHYLGPAYRDTPGRVGLLMWRKTEAALKELGVKVILTHDNAVRPLLPFFLGLGYQPRSTMWWRVIP